MRVYSDRSCNTLLLLLSHASYFIAHVQYLLVAFFEHFEDAVLTSNLWREMELLCDFGDRQSFEVQSGSHLL